MNFWPATNQRPIPVVLGPSWMRTKVGDRIVTWLYTRPEWLHFHRTSHDEAWFYRLNAVPDLRILGFEETSFGDAGLRFVEPLANLESLEFDDCPKITDAALPLLSGFTRLRSLSLQGTSVTDAGMPELARLQKLEGLSLQDTTVSDAGLAYVAQLQNLDALTLGTSGVNGRSARITDRGLLELARLPKLKLIWLWDVEMTDAAVETLCSMPQLSMIWLACPHATADEVRRLRLLTGLFRLSLADANLGDEVVDALLELPVLEKLYLDRSRITDA
jgi:Leucine-rich repeat (LRR) protein